MNNKKPSYNIKRNATLRNRINNETFAGDIINEECIDGKTFFVIRNNGKVFKLNKDSYVVSTPR